MSIGEMKALCIETLRTFSRLPPDRIGGGSAWPEIARERGKDYAPDQTSIRLRPTAKDISDAEQFTDLVNQVLDEPDRKKMWQWGWIKVRTDRTVRGYCEKNGLYEHNYRRQIDKIFQTLAENAKDFALKSVVAPVDDTMIMGDKRIRSETFFRSLPGSEQKDRRRALLQDLLKRTDSRA